MTAAGRTSFSSKLNKPTCASTSTYSAFDKLVEDITSNKSKIRTFNDVHESYLHGGKGYCRSTSMTN